MLYTDRKRADFSMARMTETLTMHEKHEPGSRIEGRDHREPVGQSELADDAVRNAAAVAVMTGDAQPNRQSGPSRGVSACTEPTGDGGIGGSGLGPVSGRHHPHASVSRM